MAFRNGKELRDAEVEGFQTRTAHRGDTARAKGSVAGFGEAGLAEPLVPTQGGVLVVGVLTGAVQSARAPREFVPESSVARNA